MALSRNQRTLFFLLVFLWAAFVWPTLYRYDIGGAVLGIRMNRFTGEVDARSGGVWKRI